MGNTNPQTAASAPAPAQPAPPAPPGPPLGGPSKKPKGFFRRISKWGMRWAGFFGILLAMIAACVNYEQVRVTRETADEQLRLSRETAIRSVRPNLRVATYLEGPGKRNGFYIENLGLGPATLSALTVVVGGQTIDLLKPDGQGLALKAMGVSGMNLACFTAIAPEVGTVIKAGEESPLMASTVATIAPLCPWLVAGDLGRQTIEVHAEYDSIWDEHRKSSQSVRLDLSASLDRFKGLAPAGAVPVAHPQAPAARAGRKDGASPAH